jgi:hypothetical protein
MQVIVPQTKSYPEDIAHNNGTVFVVGLALDCMRIRKNQQAGFTYRGVDDLDDCSGYVAVGAMKVRLEHHDECVLSHRGERRPTVLMLLLW